MDYAGESHLEKGIQQSFPVRGRIRGWFFRVEELPSGDWQVRGRDRHGQTVSVVGTGPEEALASAESEAQILSSQNVLPFP